MAKKLKKKIRKKRMYNVGGTMYNNTIPPGLSTTNIVLQENDPAIQAEREKVLNEQTSNLIQKSSQLSDDILNQEAEDNQAVQNLAALDEAKSQSIDNIIGKSTTQIAKEAKGQGILNQGQNLANKIRLARAANLTKKATELTAIGQKGIDAGVQTLAQSQATEKGAQLAGKAAQLTQKATGVVPGVTAEVGKTAVTEGTKTAASSAASSVGANANLYALGANVVGKGIKMAADDDDPTTWTFGEASGDVLSEAGEYAGYGATIGSIVPGIGNAVGAGVGAIVGTVKGLIEGFGRRRKARKAKKAFENERAEKVREANKETRQALATAQTNVRAGNIRRKTKSGYDLGINTTAMRGGLRMGMPRYGY